MGIINDNFMIYNDIGQHLYDTYAKNQPIIDYHCHLDARMIAENHKFKDAYELFLGGDHYKWRQMRSNGIEERFITGDADRHEKWAAYADTMPWLIGNPLYHWTQLELKRYFDIDEPLNGGSAERIWNKCGEMLKTDDLSVRRLIERSNVEVICTTDDPFDNLEYHKQIDSSEMATKVLPTFRPDKTIGIENAGFAEYINSIHVENYRELKTKLSERMDFFGENGCRLSDHSLSYVPFAAGNAAAVFEKKMNGGNLTQEETDIYKTDLLTYCAAEYAKRGWAMQIHIGALRNNNTRMFNIVGADAGFDSINDLSVAEKLSAFMDNLETDNALPKTILYTLNPKDNYVLGTMIGNFQRSPIPSKIQFGSGWWFNDNRDGMTKQLTALANLGILGRFVGMLTDSRSFVSYTRHEYFRRILCNLIGEWVAKGEYPNDEKALKQIVEGICYNNAKAYFNF